jgi:DNA processing protein
MIDSPDGLLDPGRRRGYLQRLTMLGFWPDNAPSAVPTTAAPVASHTDVLRQIDRGADEFPVALTAIPQPVHTLWVRGRTPAAEQRTLGIVGARAATQAGCRLASAMAGAAAGRGFAVISGGALGIDAAAHRGALMAGGATYAVLGCGVDVVYPDRHVDLFAEIAASGGLLSELPPGEPPRRSHFPSRNRIVVGLSGSVLVVEAQARSGALITARLARRMGRMLLAVPGSPGTDRLIAAGRARAVVSVDELLLALAGVPAPPRIVPEAFASLVSALGAGPASAPELARRLGLSLPAALALIFEAELGGWIGRGAGGVFEAAQTEDTRGN